MKFTRDWLFDHLATDHSLEEILEALPMLGLEVEDVQDRAAALASFTIAEVIFTILPNFLSFILGITDCIRRAD